MLKQFQDAILLFFRTLHKKSGTEKCSVGLDKGAPEIKTDVESHST